MGKLSSKLTSAVVVRVRRNWAYNGVIIIRRPAREKEKKKGPYRVCKWRALGSLFGAGGHF